VTVWHQAQTGQFRLRMSIHLHAVQNRHLRLISPCRKPFGGHYRGVNAPRLATIRPIGLDALQRGCLVCLVLRSARK